MKARELIAKLQEIDPEAEVITPMVGRRGQTKLAAVRNIEFSGDFSLFRPRSSAPYYLAGPMYPDLEDEPCSHPSPAST